MGSCPYPGVSLVYSVLSTMPYMAAFALGLLALVKRRLSLFGAFFIVASCYLLTDGYIKKIVQGNNRYIQILGLLEPARRVTECQVPTWS